MQKTKSIIVPVLIALGLGLQAQQGGADEKTKPVYKAPSGKAYPAHWGAPPRLQTRDLRELPGGYGRGSGTLARWIQLNLDKDAKKDNPGSKPKVTKKAYPKHWGNPPNLQTSDYRPLPGGYGFGSSIVARWIQQNLDKDAKNGVPVLAPPVAIDPVAPRPVTPPVFDPNAKAREQAKEQVKVDTAKVKKGIKAWEVAKGKCKGNYSYKVGFTSFVGFGHETTVVVRNNKVAERHFRTFNRARPIAPPRPGGGVPAQPKTISWVETGKAIGTNKRGSPARTLDELYEIALETAQKKPKQFERRYIRSDKQGLLVSCYIMDRRIADDAPRNGLVVSSIQLGGGNEGGAAVAPPTAVGGGDCALCRTEAHQLHLGQAENGGIITVKKGSTVKVKLKGNPTTGFTWNDKTPAGILKLSGKISHQAGGRVLGAPGMSTVTYQAMKNGKSEIVLEYRRVFEDKPPLNTVKINIVVTENGRATAEPAANKNQARIAELEKEIAQKKDFAKRARFTREGLVKFNAELKALETEVAKLKSGADKPARVHKAPNGKAFPAHWGAPPLRQTRDLRPLPGGYGQGSGTLARWIQGKLDNDAKGEAKPGVKPRPPIVVRPGIPNRPGGRKKFPSHWGDPPRLQTRDLRPLPGGYGVGSGTLARWIQQNLEKDAAGRKPGGANAAKIAKLKAEIAKLENLKKIARFTPQGLTRINAKITDLKAELAELEKESAKATKPPVDATTTPRPVRPRPDGRPTGGRKPFPEHWGQPPRIQTRDLRPLPGGYGRGSSTLARWIQQNLDKDAAGRKPGGSNAAEIAKLKAEIAKLENLKKVARFTQEGLAKINVQIKELKEKLAKLEKDAAKAPPAAGRRPPVSATFAKKHPQGSYSSGELLVGMDKGLELATIKKSLAAAVPGLEIRKAMINNTILHVRLPDSTNVEQAMTKLKSVKGVRYSEVNGIVRIQPVPQPGIGILPVPRQPRPLVPGRPQLKPLIQPREK